MKTVKKQEKFEAGIYRHYKGGLYTALLLVEHHDAEETFVVYVSLKYGYRKIREWDSPGKDSWTDIGYVEWDGKGERQFIVSNDPTKKLIQRFTLVVDVDASDAADDEPTAAE